MKVRKIPVIYEAYQWEPKGKLPDWVLKLPYVITEEQVVYVFVPGPPRRQPLVIQPWDWILRCEDGGLATCTTEIFKTTYEEA